MRSPKLSPGLTLGTCVSTPASHSFCDAVRPTSPLLSRLLLRLTSLYHTHCVPGVKGQRGNLFRRLSARGLCCLSVCLPHFSAGRQ